MRPQFINQDYIFEVVYQKKNSILVYAFEQAAYHAVNMTFFTPTSVCIIADDFFCQVH